MKSKGFTLVEIMAVIAILAILIGIAVPNMVSLSARNKNKMFCTKVQNIESVAQQYAEDNFSKIETAYNSGTTFEISVKELIDLGYFKKEDENCNFSDSKPCVTDPRDKTSMDLKKVNITIKNRRPYAKYVHTELDKTNKTCDNQ